MSQRKPNGPAAPPENQAGKGDSGDDLPGVAEAAPRPRSAAAGPGTAVLDANRGRDVYEGSKAVHEARQLAQTETAPEVSRGAWRERAFVPRGTMPREQILFELDRVLQVACLHKGPIEGVLSTLKTGWAPLLRQAVEQGGGDGIDACLRAMLKVSGPAGVDPLVGELVASMSKMNSLSQVAALVAEAKQVIEAVSRATDPDSAKRISLKVLERQLEGRIDVDALLEILFCDDDDLVERLDQVERTIQTLRDQLRAMPGSKPDGMFSNYTRLKAEKRVIEGEQARRASRSR